MAQDHAYSAMASRVRPGPFCPRSSITPGLVEPRQAGLFLSHLPVQPIRYVRVTNNGTIDQQDRDYQVVSYGDLHNLLPEPKPSGRIEVGLLPDGRAYAPKTASREQYILFPTKLSYILYFTHYYFSLENLSKDSTLLGMLINRRTIPLDKLIQAPRLSAVNTTPDEAMQALVGSNVVCIEDMGNGVRGVSRRDKFPSEGSVFCGEYLKTEVSSKSFVPSTVSPTQNATGDVNIGVHSVTQLETCDPDVVYHNCLPVVSVQTSLEPKASVQSVSVASEPFTSFGFNPAQSCASATNRPPTSPTRVSNSPECSSNAHLPPSVSLSYSRFNAPGWSNTVSAFGGAQSEGTLPSAPEINITTYNAAIPCPQSYPSVVHLNALSPSDMSQVSFLPLRQPPVFGSYIMNQASSPQCAYPPVIAQVSSSGTPLNLTVAASMVSQHHPIAPVSPFGNNLLSSSSHFTPHQANAALTAAYMAMAQQQQQQAAYLQATLPPGLHPHLHSFHPANASQSAIPFYYSTQPIHLPLPFPRHSVHRPAYPMQAYSYHPAVLPNQIAIVPEVTGPLNKSEATVQFVNTGNPHQVPTSISYPLLLQQQMQLPHTNTLDPRLAFTGLHLQRSAAARHCTNSFSLGQFPVPLNNYLAPPTNGNITVPTASVTSSSDTGIDVATEADLSSDMRAMSLRDESTDLDASITATARHLSSSSVELCSTPTISLRGEPPADEVATRKSVQPVSGDDSEDSASSGIGEMNSVCSSATSDARTTSSRTLTDNAIDTEVYTPFNVCKLYLPTGCMPEPGSKA